MDNFFGQSLILLTAPPANLVYHLVLAFSILAALRPSLIHQRISPHPLIRRKILGFSFLLLAQVVLYVASGLAWQGIVDPHLVLPPVDRAVVAFSLLWIVWVWAFPKRLPLVDALLWVFTLLIAIFLVVNFVAWSATGSTQPYNFTWFNFIWEVFSIYILLNGCLVLLLRKPPAWGIGLGMFLLLLAGYTIQLVAPFPPGDFLGGVRLAMVAAFPLLMALPARQADPYEIYQPNFLAQPHPITGERRRFSSDIKTWQTFLDLVTETTPDQFCTAATRAVAQATLADICYFISYLPGKTQIVFEGGYDLVHDEPVPGAVLEAARAPKLAKAIKEGKTLVINDDFHTNSDLTCLSEVTNFPEPGNLLLVPFVSEMNAGTGGLLLLSPYSSRKWTEDEVTYLKPAGAALVQNLHRIREYAHYQDGYQTAHADLQTALTELDQLRSEHQDLVQRFILLRSQVSQLDADLSSPAPEETRTDVDFEKVQTSGQQLRQTANTILGYTELLLGETLGGLAIPQRKFLEQIRDAAVAANQASENLLELQPVSAGEQVIVAETVDLQTVIEKAIQETATNKLALTVEIPDDLPLVNTHQEALQTVVRGFLDEAAWSDETTVNVHLAASVENSSGQVRRVRLVIRQDRGVFEESDLPAVFNVPETVPPGSEYPQDGINDRLKAAKILIESQGGRIWVDQDEGDLVTVQFLLDTVQE